MYMNILNWGSPKGIGYELNRGWGSVKEERFIFDKDVVRRPEDATDEMPFAGDVIQKVIDENNITNAINIPMGFEDILSNIQIPERTFTPPKGRAVWFPVHNGIEVTDPWSTAADPAMGYVKSVDENGMIEIDVRQVYKRTEAPNIADESRKMEPLAGTVHIEGKYCFEKRMDCMDYIISQSARGSFDPVFRAEIKPISHKESLQLTDEDLAGLTDTESLVQ